MTKLTSKIFTGDAISVLQNEVESNSIDCCVTSPPYYGLRDYGVAGQIGLESTVEEYINKLVLLFQEVKRVLKQDGTLWVNIADSYAGSGKGRITGHLTKNCLSDYKVKDLMGIPWLLALALRSDGWYLRQDIIWNKTNCMPESVKDRCTRSHEYIFLLSKSRKYYFDFESIKEPCVGFDKSSPRGSLGTLSPNAGRRKGNNKSFKGGGVYTNSRSYQNSADRIKETIGNVPNISGLKNKRDVWSVATRGSKVSHFATFPEKLIEPCILAGCRQGGIVLDPFLGSGTTAVVAQKYGRGYIGIDINPCYTEMAQQRL